MTVEELQSQLEFQSDLMRRLQEQAEQSVEIARYSSTIASTLAALVDDLTARLAFANREPASEKIQ